MNIISFVLFVKRYSNEYLRSVNQANNDMKYNELEYYEESICYY